MGLTKKISLSIKSSGTQVRVKKGFDLLASYNSSPWDVDLAKITFAELYERWLYERGAKMPPSTLKSLKSGYRHCKALHARPYREIRAPEMQKCVDGEGLSYATQGKIRSLLSNLDKFAAWHEVTDRMCSLLLTSAPIPETSRVPFSEEEIATLWVHKDDPWVDIVLILIYSGWRFSEIRLLRAEEVDLEAGTMLGGVKTSAGKNRIVPIHSLIRPFIKARLAEDGAYLLCGTEKSLPMSETYFRKHWGMVMERLEMVHVPHDCRHTFETLLDAAKANRKCIDLMMGHKSKDIGQRVYNHKTLNQLKESVELVTR
ncbi:MAG: tyrosine-type recombinase/integrase [Oscillospiraceae bacterium]|nr:tyrosine-type recombinase/integrase [Oscillospiraceae bacterium]